MSVPLKISGLINTAGVDDHQMFKIISLPLYEGRIVYIEVNWMQYFLQNNLLAYRIFKKQIRHVMMAVDDSARSVIVDAQLHRESSSVARTLSSYPVRQGRLGKTRR